MDKTLEKAGLIILEGSNQFKDEVLAEQQLVSALDSLGN